MNPLEAFNLNALPRLVLGVGCRAQLGLRLRELCGGSPQTCILVTGGSSLEKSGHLDAILVDLRKVAVKVEHLRVCGEPSVEWVEAARVHLGNYAPDGLSAAVVAIGGGSVLDSGKALAALLTESGRVIEYLEGVGSQTPSGRILPWIALPTTAGTGSEATTNAVLGGVIPPTTGNTPGESVPFKKSLRHPHYAARTVLLDPELAWDCPAPVTAACGLDAFTQLLESLVSAHSNPLTEAWCLQGLQLLVQNLENAVLGRGDRGQQLLQRSALGLAAFLSGMALSTSGLGTVHGLAGPLGAHTRVPHGVACGLLLSSCTRENIAALQRSSPNSRALELYNKVGGYCASAFASGSSVQYSTGADALLQMLFTWRERFPLQNLSHYGLTEDSLQLVVAQGSDRNNPIALGREVWERVLRENF